MPQSGQILHHRYELSQPFSENADQQTWLAIDRASPSQPTVVIKLLAMSPQMPWDAAKLLEREAQLLQKLNHPRIPRYGDYFLVDQLPDSRFSWFCLVQSHVPGHSLQQLLDQGRRFTEAEVEKVAIELLSILVYLHEFVPPILHRDIKPSNVIWGEDDRLYLIDFGSVQDQAALEGATFTVVGTYGYVPMEQFGGQAVPASDLYALGATLIHLLTGTAPADLPHQNARIQFAQQVSIDPAFVNWVGKLTEPDIADRLPTARQALAALEQRQHLTLPIINRKPKGSQIRLQKTINQLELKIPPRGWQSVSWLYCLSALGGMWYILFQIPNMLFNPGLALLYLPIIAGSILVILVPAFTQTTIRGDRTHLTFAWTLFGITVRKKLAIADIQAFVDVYEQEKIGSKGIVMQFGTTALATNPMAEVERHWVIQEIKDWLHPGQSQSSLAESATTASIRGSQIAINASADELVIRYPGTEKYWVTARIPLLLLWVWLTWVMFPSIGLGAPFASLLPILIVGIIVGRIYTKQFPTVLHFDQDRFVAYKSILGRPRKLFSAASADIRETTLDTLKKQQLGIIRRYLTLRTNTETTYTFGLGWTKPELEWVSQSINQWLQQQRHET